MVHRLFESKEKPMSHYTLSKTEPKEALIRFLDLRQAEFIEHNLGDLLKHFGVIKCEEMVVI